MAVLTKTCGVGQGLEEIDEAIDLNHIKQRDTFLCPHLQICARSRVPLNSSQAKLRWRCRLLVQTGVSSKQVSRLKGQLEPSRRPLVERGSSSIIRYSASPPSESCEEAFRNSAQKERGGIKTASVVSFGNIGGGRTLYKRP